MKTNALGNTGLWVSELCFGALTIGPLQADLPLDAGAHVVAHALSNGINFLDTAQYYCNYDYLREGLRRAGNPDAVICSKTYAYTAEGAKAAVEEARRALGRDVIDIFMLHEQESALTLRGHREALDYLYDCKAKGIVSAVGISTHHVAAVEAATALGVDVIHPLLNIAGLGIVDGSREDMESAIRSAKTGGIGIYAMKALGGGNLFKSASDCLNYLRDLDAVDAIAIGMQSTGEVDANIHFFKAGAFTEQDRAYLNQRVRRLHIDDWCEGCATCVKRCSHKALSLVDGKALCDHTRCMLCGYCSSQCPAWAIKVV